MKIVTIFAVMCQIGPVGTLEDGPCAGFEMPPIEVPMDSMDMSDQALCVGAGRGVAAKGRDKGFHVVFTRCHVTEKQGDPA